jgi:deoxyribodipyrimidine photo-lyase
LSARGLFWFTNDLRIHDNAALVEACRQSESLLCVFCIDKAWAQSTGLNARPMGELRQAFLDQSLLQLAEQLQQHDQSLMVIRGNPVKVLSALIQKYDIESIYRSHHVGVYENRQWLHLQADFPKLNFNSIWTHSLFSPEQLPFTLAELPNSFSQFRKQVEHLVIDKCFAIPVDFPALITKPPELRLTQQTKSEFEGGEKAAIKQLEAYFSSAQPASYKQTRNELTGWTNSTKFSPWLANGSLSVKRIVSRLKNYEADQIANESTYWIYFELLWREYFQWVALKLGHKLFRASGVNASRQRCCFYPERYQKWCHGNTPYPLVNALMKQLNQTGYMSNRGRQIVASCLINELELDWRYGAAYFEQQLIDYDVGSNWGNWAYIAGVGMDPRGGRHFNIEKQTKQYDPDSRFIKQWQGDQCSQQLDSVDAADWPILPDK